MAKKTLEPQQARSRESMQKLMKAAAEVLGQHGVEGATIPRIAKHAGLTPGAVYRRFPDKDALMETVILGILERQDQRLRASITLEHARQIPLPVFADQIINGIVVSNRMNGPLLRALHQFAQARPHTPFWKKAVRLELSTYAYLLELFLTHRKEIRHPDPRAAVSLGLMMVISTVFRLVVEPTDPALWKDLLPKDDLVFKRELVNSFLAYLGVAQKRA